MCFVITREGKLPGGIPSKSASAGASSFIFLKLLADIYDILEAINLSLAEFLRGKVDVMFQFCI